MRQARGFVLATLILALMAPRILAQAGGGAAGGGGGAAGAAQGAAGAAAEKKGFLKKFCQELADCRRKLCKTPLGQLLNKMTQPASAMTGGVLPTFCPAMPSEKDQKEPGVTGDAAKAKADAVQAAARAEAVNYLATLDCHWHPEAEKGLIAALRTDRNECVRLAAAQGLNRACCCTEPVIKALRICVSASDEDGNPCENSPRVRAVACVALEHCLACYIEKVKPAELKKDEKQEEKKPTTEEAPRPKEIKDKADDTGLAPVTGRVSPPPSRETVALARKALAEAKAKQAAVVPSPLAPGNRGLANIINYAIDGSRTSSTVVMSPVPMTGSPPLNSDSFVPATTQVPVTEPMLSPPVTPANAPGLAKVTATTFKPVEMPPAPPAVVAPVVAPAPMITEPIKPKIGPVMAVPATDSHRIPPPELTKAIEIMQNHPDVHVRHNAVRSLATMNWREHPEAVGGLVHCARSDKEAALRVACVRYLALMKACTPLVMTGLRPMLDDSDEWIRDETRKALDQLQTWLPKDAAMLQSPLVQAEK